MTNNDAELGERLAEAGVAGWTGDKQVMAEYTAVQAISTNGVGGGRGQRGSLPRRRGDKINLGENRVVVAS
ncbi:hypothetical protein NL676_008578 [Syzygium grande]|nr:hypothetical protein NL676_008578 [Syzygium grande]